MESFKTSLTIAVLLCGFRRIESVTLGGQCTALLACTDTVNHVCEITVGNTGTCVVKANGAASGCTGANTNCPSNAACQGGLCSCTAGYSPDSNGLCEAVIGMVCANDAECTTALVNTRCQIHTPCTRGRCECTDGYTGQTGQICTAVPATKAHGEACVVGDTCIATTSCTGGSCQCTTPGHTYKPSITMCTDKALFNEACTQLTNCLVTTNGACTGGVCTCASGYIEDVDSSSCRAPHRDEVCDVSNPCTVSVDTRTLLAGESSSVVPTCSASTCSCATGSTPFERQFMGTCYRLCITDPSNTNTLRANGEQCSNFNDCISRACYQCPEDDAPVCHSADCGGTPRSTAVEVTVSKIMLVGVLTVLNHLL